MKLKYTIAALAVTTVGANAALTSTKDYTTSGLDFTGTVNGGLVWGMNLNPINNVAQVDVDGNSTKDFHESASSAVDPSDGKASNLDGILYRWDYGGSPSRAAGIESTDAPWTIEAGLDIKSTGTEGSRGVFGFALEFNTAEVFIEVGRTGYVFGAGTVIDPATILAPFALTQSNVGFHTYRIAYDDVASEIFIYRDNVLLNINGVGIANATNLGNVSSTFIGDYSSGLAGDWELDYLALDTTGAFAPVPEPSSTALLGLGGLALILRRRK